MSRILIFSSYAIIRNVQHDRTLMFNVIFVTAHHNNALKELPFWTFDVCLILKCHFLSVETICMQ
jgi:hypothetical protein